MDQSEHPGVPQRPPASAMLLVSSTDRYKEPADRLVYPTTSANWTLNLKAPVLNGYFTRLALSQLQVQWNMPTIIENRNDAIDIQWTSPGGPLNDSVVLNPAFYSPTELAAEIENVILATANGTSAGFTCAWTGQYFQMRCATAGWTLFFNAYPAGVDPTGEIYNRFLFTIGGNGDVVANGFDTGPPQMTYTRWIDIVSDRLTKFQRVKDSSSLPNSITQAIIARVYPCPPNVSLNESQPGQLFAQPWVMTIDYNTPKHIKWSPDEALHNFDIRVLDEFGEEIFWSSQWPTEYQLTFLASET